MATTLGLVHQDTEHVGEVSQASEEEEEHADAFCRLAAVVEQELRNTGSEIQDCADVAGDLAPEIEMQCGLG